MPKTYNKIKRPFLYDFLIHPRYRIWRHTLLLVAMIIISLNQAFTIYSDNLHKLGNDIYLISFAIFLIYIVIGYFGLYVLVPKYLFARKYLYYIGGMILSVLVMILFLDGLEYFVHYIYKLTPGDIFIFSSTGWFLMDVSSSFFTYGTAIAGISIIPFFKQWMIESQRKNKMEVEHVESQVENLKEQITPTFLFSILNRTGTLAQSDPDLASEMLMKLSQVLRYQLYDSSREKVLLSSEITFIRNYLNLEQLYFPGFNYNITIEGNVNPVFLPPLLFIPFIQYSIGTLKEASEEVRMEIMFLLKDDYLEFLCNCKGKDVLRHFSLINIKRRLDLLFPQKYNLMTESSKNQSFIKLSLKIKDNEN